MNSAVEPLLKVINDLKNKVSELELKVVCLEWDVSRLKDELRNSTSNITSIPYRQYPWTSYTSETSTPYWEPVIPNIQHVSPNDNWTLTFTYDDGRTITISPTV